MSEIIRDLLRTLRSFRVRSGISQLEMAEKTHISQSSVSRIETGSRAAKVEDVLRMAEVLGLKIGWNAPGSKKGIRVYHCNHCHEVVYADAEYHWCPKCGYEGELVTASGQIGKEYTMKEQGLSALEQLKEQQMAGCTFIVTIGECEEYQIEYVTQGWSFALAVMQKMGPRFQEEKRVEVWKGSLHLGDWEEVVVKGKFDALGKPEIDKGVRWVPNEAIAGECNGEDEESVLRVSEV